MKAIDFAEAVMIFHKEYEKAKQLEYVRKPIAYAMYNAWEIVDRRERERKSI